jgi:hypothetical protein
MIRRQTTSFRKYFPFLFWRFEMKNKALALLAGVALSATAFADETVVVTPAADQAAVVETAKLDTTAVEQTAAVEMFGMSSGVTTGLIFGVVAVTTFVVTTDGDAQGIQVPDGH